MIRPPRENLIEIFNNDYLTEFKFKGFENHPKKVSLRRTKRFELELTISVLGWSNNESPEIPAGTIYQSKETIEFTSFSGTKYILHGIIELSRTTNHSADGIETKYCYSVSYIELQKPHSEIPEFVIEWVGNISRRLIGNSFLSIQHRETSEFKYGDGDSSVVISDDTELPGSQRIMHLQLAFTNIYIIKITDNEDQDSIRGGYIIYKKFEKEETRRKMRDCLSFILGLPIVVFGFTEYTVLGKIVRMKSLSILSLNGRIFELNEMPPYPIASGCYRDMPDLDLIQTALDSIYANYDELKFNELCWTYWHGACAPATMSAVYFGGLCEQLQKYAIRKFPNYRSTLIRADEWKILEAKLLESIRDTDIDIESVDVLRNKIRGLNQLPQSISLGRLLKYLGLSISEVERLAWSRRNIAAHGGMNGTTENIILQNKLLRLMFHRMLASVTKCSNYYIDYYSLDFPTRLLSEQIPSRSNF